MHAFGIAEIGKISTPFAHLLIARRDSQPVVVYSGEITVETLHQYYIPIRATDVWT